MKHSSWLVNLGTYTSWFYGENELTHRETYQPTSSLYDLFPGESGEKMWHLGVFPHRPSLSTRVWGMATKILDVTFSRVLTGWTNPGSPAILEVDVTGAHQFHISAAMCHWKPENSQVLGEFHGHFPFFGDFIYFIHIFHRIFPLDTLETIHWSILGFHDLPSGNLT